MLPKMVVLFCENIKSTYIYIPMIMFIIDTNYEIPSRSCTFGAPNSFSRQQSLSTKSLDFAMSRASRKDVAKVVSKEVERDLFAIHEIQP